MFSHSPQSAILNSMRFAPIASILMTCLTLNAQTIQGKVVRVSDGDTIAVFEVSNTQHTICLYGIGAMEKTVFRKHLTQVPSRSCCEMRDACGVVRAVYDKDRSFK